MTYFLSCSNRLIYRAQAPHQTLEN